MNRDVDYTRTVEAPYTLEMDFTQAAQKTDDSENIFALSANLYGFEVPPQIPSSLLANQEGKIRLDSGHLYLDLRAIAAKRSVAENSMAALAAMKSSGDPEAGKFLKKLVEELGVPQAELDKLLGKNPSYFAQMEVLTKKIYQNPVFYTELYDKPVNVTRKEAALEAIHLMQDRDIYRSLLRSEAIGSVILETMLAKEQDKVKNEVERYTKSGTGQ
jgi:hypothetical protein